MPLRGASWQRNHEVEAAIRRKDDVGDDDDVDELSIYDDNGQAKNESVCIPQEMCCICMVASSGKCNCRNWREILCARRCEMGELGARYG